jgi:cardiolipin synthase
MSPEGGITFKESSIEEIAGLPFIKNNRVRLLETGQVTFLKILDSISAARDIICIDFYLFRDDDTGDRLAQVLKEKAREGVNVYVVYDHFGSLSTSRSFWSAMRHSGVKLKTSHPFDFSAPLGYFYRNHKKLMIIDGREAFIGGFNIANEYHGSLKKALNTWRDTGIHLQGPIAFTLLDMFMRRWRFLKRKPVHWQPSSINLDDGVSVIPIFAHSGKSRRRMRKLFIHSINNSKKSILLTTAYFIPGRRILRALERAGRRGVELKLLLPGITDIKPAFHAGRAYYKRLLQAGVEIYTYQGTVLHAKTAVFDDCWSIIGSANLDHQSFRRNEESNVGVLDPAFGGVMRKAFQADVRQSIRIHPATWYSRPLYQKILERFFSHLLRKL